MNSKTRLHVAMFPSLRAIAESGGSDELVSRITGSYSGGLYNNRLKPRSRFVSEIFHTMTELIKIHWKANTDDPAVTVQDILESLALDGIPDIAIEEMEILVKWLTWTGGENVETIRTWQFHPYTFRPGVWKRLKADVFPSQKLYRKYKEVRKRLTGEDEILRKRVRDKILMNHELEDVPNDDIRGIWSHKPYVLILTETSGQYELMNLGEYQ